MNDWRPRDKTLLRLDIIIFQIIHAKCKEIRYTLLITLIFFKKFLDFIIEANICYRVLFYPHWSAWNLSALTNVFYTLCINIPTRRI